MKKKNLTVLLALLLAAGVVSCAALESASAWPARSGAAPYGASNYDDGGSDYDRGGSGYGIPRCKATRSAHDGVGFFGTCCLAVSAGKAPGIRSCRGSGF